MIISTMNDLPGYHVDQVLGEVTGLTVRARNVHNIAVEGAGVDTEPSETVQGGGTAELTVDLPAGAYEDYCAVPGHREGGMEGKLTVK